MEVYGAYIICYIYVRALTYSLQYNKYFIFDL